MKEREGRCRILIQQFHLTLKPLDPFRFSKRSKLNKVVDQDKMKRERDRERERGGGEGVGFKHSKLT